MIRFDLLCSLSPLSPISYPYTVLPLLPMHFLNERQDTDRWFSNICREECIHSITNEHQKETNSMIKVKGHAAVLFGCQCCLLCSITLCLCIFEAIDLPLLRLKDDETLHNALWMKNTIAIVCRAQKDCSPQSRLHKHKPGNLFFLSYVAGKKTQVFR